MAGKHYELKDGAECEMCCDIGCCDTYTKMIDDLIDKLVPPDLVHKMMTDDLNKDEEQNLMYGIYLQEVKSIIVERKAELMKKLQEEGHSNE